MIRISVTNSSKNLKWQADFTSQSLADAWITEQVALRSWGVEERWVRYEVEGADTREVEDLEGTHTEYRIPSEYTISQTDVTAEYAALQAARTLTTVKTFSNQLLDTFTLENINLGIRQDGMTNQVRKAMSEVISALYTGSLYDAMDEARAIPADKKDLKYITDVRLLTYINKIETFLGLPLSTEL